MFWYVSPHHRQPEELTLILNGMSLEVRPSPGELLLTPSSAGWPRGASASGRIPGMGGDRGLPVCPSPHREGGKLCVNWSAFLCRVEAQPRGTVATLACKMFKYFSGFPKSSEEPLHSSPYSWIPKPSNKELTPCPAGASWTRFPGSRWPCAGRLLPRAELVVQSLSNHPWVLAFTFPVRMTQSPWNCPPATSDSLIFFLGL